MRVQLQILIVFIITKLINATFEHAPYKLAYANAIRYCKGRYMDLVKVEDEEKNKLVVEYARKESLGKFWIDGNDISQETVWVNSEGKELEYRHWNPKKPSGGNAENCIQLDEDRDGFWYDLNCEKRISVICETDKPVRETEADFITSSKRMSYKEATTFCDQLLRQVVKVPDSQTNIALYKYSKEKRLGEYWINGNDEVLESVWVDSDGYTLPFNDWYSSDPDGGKNENCVIGGVKDSPAWEDVSCTKDYFAIC